MAKWKVSTLLEILHMPEDRQKVCLAVDGVLGDYSTESLAETAFRMRNEVIKAGCDWLSAVCEVIEYCEGQEYCDECGQKHKTEKYFNWSEDAQPIHWIIAALIAEVRKEEEMLEKIG